MHCICSERLGRFYRTPSRLHIARGLILICAQVHDCLPSLRTLVVGNMLGYLNAKCMDLGEKAEKTVLLCRAGFLLTTIAGILPIGGK